MREIRLINYIVLPTRSTRHSTNGLIARLDGLGELRTFGASTLGHIGTTTTAAADDADDLLYDGPGPYRFCKVIGNTDNDAGLSFILPAEHDDTGLKSSQESVRKLAGTVGID